MDVRIDSKVLAKINQHVKKTSGLYLEGTIKEIDAALAAADLDPDTGEPVKLTVGGVELTNIEHPSGFPSLNGRAIARQHLPHIALATPAELAALRKRLGVEDVKTLAMCSTCANESDCLQNGSTNVGVCRNNSKWKPKEPRP